MKVDLGNLNAFVAVARAGGFRDGARASGGSASTLSEAVRRLETQLGVRLLNRTTRSVTPTEAGCDAGIRYDDRLEQDMIAVPIGPRIQRFATAASPAYLDRRGRPEHPRELLGHACLRSRFSSGTMTPWEFERSGDTVRIDPAGPLLVRAGGGTDLALEAAVAGTGIIYLFEDWLRPHLNSGALEPVLEPWWLQFSGPFLYYSGRHLVPAPLRAFIDFVKHSSLTARASTPT